MSNKIEDLRAAAKHAQAVSEGMAVGGAIAGISGIVSGMMERSATKERDARILDALELTALSTYAQALPSGSQAHRRVMETAAEIAGRIVVKVNRSASLAEAVAATAVSTGGEPDK